MSRLRKALDLWAWRRACKIITRYSEALEERWLDEGFQVDDVEIRFNSTMGTYYRSAWAVYIDEWLEGAEPKSWRPKR